MTLWHIGRDSLQEYSGDKFHCSWQVAKNLFLRIYSKEMKLEARKDKKSTIIRTEVQENPDIVTRQLAEFVKISDESLPSKFFENNPNSSIISELFKPSHLILSEDNVLKLFLKNKLINLS